MEHEFALKPRTLTTEGIIRNGEVGVVESPGPTCAYIPNSAVTGNQFRLLNTSDHVVEVRVQDDAFPLELVDADPTDTIDVPIGSMFFAVAGWSKVHNQFQLFATVTRATHDDGGGTPQPGGDFLPKNNPEFTGLMTGGGIKSNAGVDAEQFTSIAAGGMSKLTMGHAGVFGMRLSNVSFNAERIELESDNEVHIASALKIDRGGESDLIAEFDQNHIRMGEPNTGYLDNPVFDVHGNAFFAMNPTLRGTLATSQLPGMALITKDQVFDVLNGARKEPRIPSVMIKVPEYLVGDTLNDGDDHQYYLAGSKLPVLIRQVTPMYGRFRVVNLTGHTLKVQVENRVNPGPEDTDLFFDMTLGESIDPNRGIELKYSSIWEFVRIPHRDGSKGSTILAYALNPGVDPITEGSTVNAVIPDIGTAAD